MSRKAKDCNSGQLKTGEWNSEHLVSRRELGGIRRVFFKHLKDFSAEEGREEWELSAQTGPEGQDEDQWSEELEKLVWAQSQKDLC